MLVTAYETRNSHTAPAQSRGSRARGTLRQRSRPLGMLNGFNSLIMLNT